MLKPFAAAFHQGLVGIYSSKRISVSNTKLLQREISNSRQKRNKGQEHPTRFINAEDAALDVERRKNQ